MLEEFLATYPFLRGDQGYIEFLETYAGAWVMQPNNDLVVNIYGFNDVSTHLVEGEGPVVDNDGFLLFAECIVRIAPGDFTEGIMDQSFAFDATRSRKWGIYRSSAIGENETDMAWYCDTFDEWLWALLEYKGRLPDHHPKFGTGD